MALPTRRSEYAGESQGRFGGNDFPGSGRAGGGGVRGAGGSEEGSPGEVVLGDLVLTHSADSG